MKKVIIVLCLTFQAVLYSQALAIKLIESPSLSEERVLFEKFLKVHFNGNSDNEVLQKIVTTVFDQENVVYQVKNGNSLYFHALLDDQVIGYISCDLVDSYHVHIRQLIIDPDIFTTNLVKELFLAIFENYSKVNYVTISCLSMFQDMIDFLKILGFVKIEQELKSSLDFSSTYQLKLGFKCKICDLLYPNIWIDEQDEELGQEEIE